MPVTLRTNLQSLRRLVGASCILAPILHSLTDALEWYQAGFSTSQLLLNYVAFLPMPWLLLGIFAVEEKPLGKAGLAGALMYGAAFTYFAHTTLHALAVSAPDYESLWRSLGPAYTVHGGLMVAGGLLFAWSAWRAKALAPVAVLLFGAGLLLNLVLALLPAPEILQTLGTLVRNAGLVGMGCALLRGGRGEVRPT